MLSAFESGEIDTDHETASDAVSQTEQMGLENSEIATGSTIVARFNVGNAPYDESGCAAPPSSPSTMPPC